MVCTNSKFTLPTKIFTGNNCVNNFIKCIFDQQKRINEIITNHFNKKLKIIIKVLKIVGFAMKN